MGLLRHSNLAFVFIPVFLSACGEKDIAESEKVIEVESSFTTYVSAFESEAVERGRIDRIDDLIVRFGDLENERHNGSCELSGDQTPIVTIDRDAWERMNEVEREALIYHELGHCILRQSHRNSLEDGVPASLMHSHSLDDLTYEENREGYLAELFAAPVDY